MLYVFILAVLVYLLNVSGTVLYEHGSCIADATQLYYTYARLPFNKSTIYIDSYTPTEQVYAAQIMAINTQMYTRQIPNNSSCVNYITGRQITPTTNTYRNCSAIKCPPLPVFYALASTQFDVGRMMCSTDSIGKCCEDVAICDIAASYDQIVPYIIANLDSNCQWIYECTICKDSDDLVPHGQFPALSYVTYDYDWYPSFRNSINYTNFTLTNANMTISKLQIAYYTGKCP